MGSTSVTTSRTRWPAGPNGGLLLNQSLDLNDYAKRLEENLDELNLLYKDLLIGVTRFFRDHEAFQRLETEVLPAALAAIPTDEEFRAWVAGCATGEEAYSLAILLMEQAEAIHRRVKVKIFATDVHRASLEFASLGVYSEAALAEVEPRSHRSALRLQGRRLPGVAGIAADGGLRPAQHYQGRRRSRNWT